MYDPTWPKYSSPYTLNNIPIPPPPPSKKRSHKVFITVVISLLLAIGASVVGIVYAEQHSNTTVSARSSTPITTPTQLTSTSQIQPTPTLGIQEALGSADFNTFLRAFAIAMASKQYTIIQSFADTNNFQAVPLCASGIGSWNSTYEALLTGNLSAVLQYPPITPQQENYQGYTDHSAPIIGNIGATAVQYDVGTLSGNDVDGTVQANRDGTVFIFESPTGSSWLWRGMISGNGCV